MTLDRGRFSVASESGRHGVSGWPDSAAVCCMTSAVWVAKVASLAWKASPTRWASAATSLFFSTRLLKNMIVSILLLDATSYE